MELKWKKRWTKKLADGKKIYDREQIYEQIVSLIVNTFQYVIRCIFDGIFPI